MLQLALLLREFLSPGFALARTAVVYDPLALGGGVDDVGINGRVDLFCKLDKQAELSDDRKEKEEDLRIISQ